MKVALIFDWLTSMGGAERCLEVFCELFPEAPIYTLVYNPEKIESEIIKKRKINTSFVQKMPFSKKKYRQYLPFFPFAIEQFDLRNYDLVLSFSHCVAKGVITSYNTCHICYCATPVRYAWDLYQEYFNPLNQNLPKKFFIPFFMNYLRIWDAVSSSRVDYYIALSKNISQKIKKYYQRDSEIIYPPVDTNFFTPSNEGEIGDYFLIVSRLVPYKKIDLAIEAFNQLGLPLIIIGEGPEYKKLKKIAKDNIKFLKRQPDEIVKKYYQKCRAFIFPGEEDFGITILEAQSCGRPVIAYRKGGALESIIEGKTGIFFPEPTVNSLIDAINKFSSYSFVPSQIREHSLKFDRAIFKEKIKNFVFQKYEK